jgi:hypothetical protein
MSSDKGDRKKEKKLRKFQDPQQTPTNRIKFLAEYTGACKFCVAERAKETVLTDFVCIFSERCSDYNEIDATFKAHHFDIVSLSHEYFVAYELQAKKSPYKHTPRLLLSPARTVFSNIHLPRDKPLSNPNIFSSPSGKTNEVSMVHLLTVLKRIMTHLQSHIAQRGGARTFST